MAFTPIAAVALALTATLATGTAGAPARSPEGPGAWPMAGQNINDTHHQPSERTISAANVGLLASRWTLTTAGAISATPTVVDGVTYVPDYGGKLWAVAADSGRVLWSKDIAGYTGVAEDVSRTSPAVDGQNLILGDGWILSPGAAGAKVFAVNRHTGKLVWSTQVDTDPASMITGSAAVYHGVIYQGISSKGEGVEASTFRGKIVALDAATGRVLWKTYTVPSNNGDNDSNLPGYYTGNAVWASSPVIDPLRGLMYVGTGNNYTVPDGVCESPGQTGCTPSAPDNYLDSVLALRLTDGRVAWSVRTIDSDLWTVPKPSGPDFDFGAAPNLFTTVDPATGHPRQLLGIGQKSGVYWAIEPSTGKVVWQTVVGPASNGGNGGIEYGTATDGQRIYIAEGNTARTPYVLGGSGPFAGKTITSGSWAAVDPATGRILWQTPDPGGSFDTSFVSSANGVVYGGSLAATGTNMYALDARTGRIRWSFASGGSVTGGAAIANGSVYWGSGYCGTQCLVDGTPTTNNNKLYAFGLQWK